MGTSFRKTADNTNLKIGIQEIQIHIADENNLDEVYLIRSDRSVNRLTVEKGDICISWQQI